VKKKINASSIGTRCGFNDESYGEELVIKSSYATPELIFYRITINKKENEILNSSVEEKKSINKKAINSYCDIFDSAKEA